jgi:hypothetical protein
MTSIVATTSTPVPHTFCTTTSPILTGGATQTRWISSTHERIIALGIGCAVFTLRGSRRPRTRASVVT